MQPTREAGALNKRDEVLDVVKGIGIVITVICHTFGGGFLAARFYIMPIFFVSAGYTFKPQPFGRFFSKKVKRLYLTFVAWETAYMLLSPFFKRIGIISDSPVTISDYMFRIKHILLFDNIHILLGPIWFLTAMFFAYMILYATDFIIGCMRLDDVKTRFVSVGIALIYIYSGIYIGIRDLFVIEWSYNFPAAVGTILEAGGFLILGKAANGIKRPNNRIAIALFAAIVVFERALKPVSDMRINAYTYPVLMPFFAVIGVTGIFAFSDIAVKVKRLSPIKDILLWLSGASIVIMCMHPLAIKLVEMAQVSFLGYSKESLLDWQLVSTKPLWLGIYVAAGVFIPAGCAAIIRKIRR